MPLLRLNMNNSISLRSILLPALSGLLLLTSCGTADHAVFVTKTSLSVLDAETAPAGVSIAYDRTEGFFGPAYQNGAAAPVTAIIQSNGNVVKPKIKQLYATGNASEIIAGRTPTDRPDLVGDKQPMFFGTTTNIGLKLAFAAKQPVPTSVNFGYKRKEASFIPIGKQDGKDHYPSVIGSIDNTNLAKDRGGADLNVVQFFATGAAADSLAKDLRGEFLTRLDEVGLYHKSVREQQGKAGEILYLYAGLTYPKRRLAWIEADKFGLFAETPKEKGALLKELQAAYDKVMQDGAVSESEFPALAKVDQLYGEALFLASAGFEPDRLKLLELHRQTVLQELTPKP